MFNKSSNMMLNNLIEIDFSIYGQQTNLQKDEICDSQQSNQNDKPQLNKFIQRAQVSEDTIVIQVFAPFVCLAQKFKLNLKNGACDINPQSKQLVQSGDSENKPSLPNQVRISKIQSLDIYGWNDGEGSVTDANQKWIDIYEQDSEIQEQGLRWSEISAHSIGNTFRLYIKINRDKQSSGGSKDSIESAISDIVDSIKLYCHPCFKMPQASSLMSLLNLSKYFEDQKREGEYIETEIMIAQSLMQARKFIQAIEKLRKTQTYIMIQYQEAYKKGTRTSLKCDIQNVAIYLEVLCADCMSQHSMQSEKIESFRRIIQMSENFNEVQPVVKNNGFPRNHNPIIESEIIQSLIKMNPQLLKIMLGVLHLNLESVKQACLKHIEFIFDNIGLSLGNSTILQSMNYLIKCYPLTNMGNLVKTSQFLFDSSAINPHYCLESFLRTTSSSIHINLTARNVQNIHFMPSYEQQYQQPILKDAIHISIFKIYSEQIKIKNGEYYHQNQMQNICNNFNHIFESLLVLINSAQTSLLSEILDTVIQQNIFKGNYDSILSIQKEQLHPDLRVYLLKMTERIANISQGDLNITQKFLNDLVKTTLPSLIVTEEQINFENHQIINMNKLDCPLDNFGSNTNRQTTVQKLLDKKQLLENPISIIHDSVRQACESLWQTLWSVVIPNYLINSTKMSLIINWIKLNLQTLQNLAHRNSAQLSVGQLQYLNKNVQIINLIVELQVNHLRQVKTQLSPNQQKQLFQRKKIRQKQMKAALRQQSFTHQTMPQQLNQNFSVVNNYQNYQVTSQNELIQNFQQMNAQRNMMLNNNGVIPDNITDLDLQNQLVDSIQDEDEIDMADQESNNFQFQQFGKDNEQYLISSQSRLQHIFYRQCKLSQDYVNQKKQDGHVRHNDRLIKIPTTNIIQFGIYDLLSPLKFWLEFSLNNKDQLELFKIVWETIKNISTKFDNFETQHAIKVDLIKIIFPNLQRVMQICKERTPSLEMLNFLIFILSDIKKKNIKRDKILRQFFLDFLLVICDCIPHNLHDEVFHISTIILELCFKHLQKVHFTKIINCLTDKYTMRSKAHKDLLKYFLKNSLEISIEQIENFAKDQNIAKFISIQLSQNSVLMNDSPPGGPQADLSPAILQSQQLNQNSRSISISNSRINLNNVNLNVNLNQNEPNNRGPIGDLVSTSQDDLDNYVYEDQESGTHVLDDDIDTNDIANINRQNQINNEYLQLQQQRRNHYRERTQYMGNQNQTIRQERRNQRLIQDLDRNRESQLNNIQGQQSNANVNQQIIQRTDLFNDIQLKFMQTIKENMTPFDIICDICLFQNTPPVKEVKNSQSDYELEIENFYEKLDIMIALFNEIQARHSYLVENILQKIQDQNEEQKIMTRICNHDESSQKKIIILSLQIADFTKIYLKQIKVNKYQIGDLNQVIKEIQKYEINNRMRESQQQPFIIETQTQQPQFIQVGTQEQQVINVVEMNNYNQEQIQQQQRSMPDNLGQTGHSEFQVRNPNLEVNHQANFEMNQQNSMLNRQSGFEFRRNINSQANLEESQNINHSNDGRINQLNLNHSHNSLMFQNHLRGLGMQNQQVQFSRPHLRSQHESIQHNDLILQSNLNHNQMNLEQQNLNALGNNVILQQQQTQEQNQHFQFPQNNDENEIAQQYAYDQIDILSNSHLQTLKMLLNIVDCLIEKSQSQNPIKQQQALSLLLNTLEYFVPAPTLVNLNFQSQLTEQMNIMNSIQTQCHMSREINDINRMIENFILQNNVLFELKLVESKKFAQSQNDIVLSSDILLKLKNIFNQIISQNNMDQIYMQEHDQNNVKMFNQDVMQQKYFNQEAFDISDARIIEVNEFCSENANNLTSRTTDLENFILADVECTDKLLGNAMTKYGLKIIKFINQITFKRPMQENVMRENQDFQYLNNSFLGSAIRQQPLIVGQEGQNNSTETNSWITQKYLCVKIISKFAELNQFENNQHNQILNIQQQLYDQSLNIATQLMGKNELEDKACAMCLIASLCGFSNQIELNTTGYLKEKIMHFVGNQIDMESLQRHLRSPQTFIEKIFFRNGKKIPTHLWQKIYQIQECTSSITQSNDTILREAASILIQLAAPRDSINHFLKISFENYKSSILQSFNRQKELLAENDFIQFYQGACESQFSSDNDDNSGSSSSSDDLNYPQRDLSVRGDHHENLDPILIEQEFKNYVSNFFYIDSYNEHNLYRILMFFNDEYSKSLSPQYNQNAFNNIQSVQYQNQYTNEHNQQYSATSEANLQQVNAQNYSSHPGQDVLIDQNEGSQDYGNYYQKHMTKSNHSGMHDDAKQEQYGYHNHMSNDSKQNSILTNYLHLQNLWIDRNFSGQQNCLVNLKNKQFMQHNVMHKENFVRLGINSKLQYDLNDAPIYDGFEDQIIQGINNNQNTVESTSFARFRFKELDNDENDYLYFNKNQSNNPFEQRSSNFDQQLNHENSPTDDLGIIDLDNDDDEEDDLFDVDDDKLPVLKNILSKTNRPNNGKSVAIGSRSQGGIMKIRPQAESKLNSKKMHHRQETNKSKKKNKNLQKPNSAQRIRSNKGHRGKTEANEQQAYSQIVMDIQNSQGNHHENEKPIVIFDEDNLINFQSLISRQRPQSGRVYLERPLSGIVTDINPMNQNKINNQSQNKFLYPPQPNHDIRNAAFQQKNQQQQVNNQRRGKNNNMSNNQLIINKISHFKKQQAPHPSKMKRNNTMVHTNAVVNMRQFQNRPTSSNNLQQSVNILPNKKSNNQRQTNNKGSPQILQHVGDSTNNFVTQDLMLSQNRQFMQNLPKTSKYGYPQEFNQEEIKVEKSHLDMASNNKKDRFKSILEQYEKKIENYTDDYLNRSLDKHHSLTKLQAVGSRTASSHDKYREKPSPHIRDQQMSPKSSEEKPVSVEQIHVEINSKEL